MRASELREWRERNGLTQAAAGEKLGVTRGTIQNWEASTYPIPPAIDTGCRIWEDRLRQIRPDLGPVTLIYSDAPMFIDPYGPRRPLAMLKQEPYGTNAAALARVRELWGAETFHNPFIMEESGKHIWNAVELGRAATGQDADAPLWRRVTISKANREEMVADSNAKALIHACVRAYRAKGLPKDVLIFRDRGHTDDYIFYFSPAAFALTNEIHGIADSIVFCDQPDPSTLKKIDL